LLNPRRSHAVIIRNQNMHNRDCKSAQSLQKQLQEAKNLKNRKRSRTIHEHFKPFLPEKAHG
jgi:hypothetical protein